MRFPTNGAAGGPFCADARRGRVAALGRLTARYAFPTMYFLREFVQAPGLMSYGGDLADVFPHDGQLQRPHS